MRKIIFIITTVIIFVTLNVLIYKKEMTLKEGKTVFLDLAPTDPRSLIQGDYMILRYRLSQEIAMLKPKNSGYVVLNELEKDLDSSNVEPRQGPAAYLQLASGRIKGLVPVRLYDGEVLTKNEYLLKYHYRNNRVQISAGKTDAYFFQEGHAKYYERARYGFIKLAKSGEAVLYKLYDNKFKVIEPLEK
ncbi:GDYXXLXY domain-containing protein [Candidatus Uabimicrobium sp. HlEnr_7]|uniref:GDYXXLXY domain-containing protein n=1 Tax=Candidatus Uabimicrobium helgolandensis TaxID=3095367 RepID=UPI00355770E2